MPNFDGRCASNEDAADGRIGEHVINSAYLQKVSHAARAAAQRKDWASVAACSSEILRHDARSAEGSFLAGLAAKAAGHAADASIRFARALELDAGRYDAAVELAKLYSAERRNGDAAQLIRRVEHRMGGSPLYLHMAATVYAEIGLPQRAYPLFVKADTLQPGTDLVLANRATCAVFLGKLDEARDIYRRLLSRHPDHQRYHYQLAKLDRAKDDRHVREMESVLERTKQPPEQNVFLYYALGKECEDLERWDAAFEWFRRAGDAVASVADYYIERDLALLDSIVDACSADWLQRSEGQAPGDVSRATPIFVVGLPRSGTTLIDRILSSHSQVASVGETQFVQMVLRRESGVVSEEKMTPAMIEAMSERDLACLRDGYLDALDYRLGNRPYFVDKLPFNVLYAGFIAKAFPDARIVLVNRDPMDVCFAMYKQVFTWAYKFSYTLDGLARFYPAYAALADHWRNVLGDRLVEVSYETLVRAPEETTRALLDALGLGFEAACLDAEQNPSATATASSVQVREKIHDRSVGRWRCYARQLEPLRVALAAAGIDVGDPP